MPEHLQCETCAAPNTETSGVRMLGNTHELCSPLSGTTNVVVRDRVAAAEIVLGYRERYRVDVRRFFEKVDAIERVEDSDTGLSFFRPMILGDERFYEDLSASVQGYYPQEKEEFAIARELIQSGDDVCEIGAGVGYFGDGIHCRSYVGLEFNPRAIAAAAERGVTLEGSDVTLFAERRSGSFDVVCAFQVLEHVADPHAFIEAAMALAKPGGSIILSTPNADAYISRCRDLLNAPPHHATWWPDRTWLWIKEHFALTSVVVKHTAIDEALWAWARMVALDGHARALGFELNSLVDESPLRRRLDAFAECTARVIVNGIRNRNDAPVLGHTSVAIFKK